ILRDEGHAGLDQAAHPTTLTTKGAPIGTPQYMSPEQARGVAVDHRADVWSLGAVLYEMLAGRPAYEAISYQDAIIRIVTGPPPMIRERAPWVPPRLAQVVHAAMEHDLARRLPDCGAFARAIAEAMA